MSKHYTNSTVVGLAVLMLTIAACGPTVARSAAAPERHATGILVMAHGGSSDWNAAVDDAVRPLRAAAATSVALGMADPATLQAAIDTIGPSVEHVVVVRLFTSGTSFMQRTEFLFGLSSDTPRFSMPGDPEPLTPVKHHASVALNPEGLVDAPVIGEILRDRAAAMSTHPPDESVLIIAHGLGDNDANDAFLDKLDGLAAPTRQLGFHSVKTATLREDWQDERKAAERRIRSFVRTETAAGRRMIVIPFRVHGFGPYAEVLEGLDYVASEHGLLPDARITQWIARQANAVARAQGWADPYPIP